jgi:hypothetical protein
MSEGIKMDMDALDRYLTGNYGEDSVGDDEDVSEDSDSPPTQNLWEWLDDSMDDEHSIVRLHHEFFSNFYRWGENYDMESSPFNLFRDLIGWSEENIGTKLCTEYSVGYLEADYLSKALDYWSTDPRGVEEWLNKVSQLELEDYDG